jgi:adenylate cyclase
MTYVWKRQLVHALQRGQVFEPQAGKEALAVGFADIVGFTRLARELNENEIAALVDGFESKAQDAATETGSRIVKTIGDEVMFVSEAVRGATEMALALTDRKEGDFEVRVGVAHGELTAHHGDYFGNTVNLASRAAGVALPGTVLISEEIAEGLSDDPGYEIKPIPRRRLKGIGHAQLYVLRRSPRG